MYKLFAITDGDNSENFLYSIASNKTSSGSKIYIGVKGWAGLMAYIRWSGNEEQIMLLIKFIQDNCINIMTLKYIVDVEKKYCEQEVSEKTRSGSVFKIDVLFKWEEIYENFKKNKKGEYLRKILYVGYIKNYMKN